MGYCEKIFKRFKKLTNGLAQRQGQNKIRNRKKKIKIGSNVKIKYVKERPGHDVRYALNSNKIMKELKWKPKEVFEVALKKTFLWYLKNNLYYQSLQKKNIHKRLGVTND